MTGLDERATTRDTETPDTIQARFGIEFLDENPAYATAVMSMPMSGLRNPFTDAPSIGPLAILVDAAGGTVNHHRRRADQWTVSSELSVELSVDSIDAPDAVVVASARPLGPATATSLAICTLTRGNTVIGGATVRSFYIPAGGFVGERPPDSLVRTAQTTLTDLMAVRPRPVDEGLHVLEQHPDPSLYNDIGIVHGGVAAAGLEVCASAAVNQQRSDSLLRTASLRVNYLRPFIAGQNSRYLGTPMRIGRRSAVGDAQAVADDDKVAITARVTAYR
ncbi:PaaI family thioesterase [Mycolicibacter kumamotonensis]|uniref:PaaI family thioesterase n=1 Tax=Mycolicibacter kumamotonensis TaxID=354243 RepID=A0A7K3L8Q9_9MYCO|nr:PaaI family thioesterase [Mycolicibacter kumamotonensis]NDJ88006.1 PaaI family thioesterase [Mycolicibacter kumamotonensis]